MIYFDKEKKAYAYEIPNYICKISDEEWEEYSNDLDSFDIVNGKLIDLRKSESYKFKKDQINAKNKIEELKDKLNKTDYIALKYFEGILSEEEYKETKEKRLSYRKQINELESLFNLKSK